jgi:hypothetical protein
MEASARSPFRYGVCGIMVNKGLSALCPDLVDPRDDSRSAASLFAVQPEQILAPIVALGRIEALPAGSVALMAR